jgi:hypothetical protein
VPAPNAPLIGDQLLAAVTDAMVAFHERSTTAKRVTAKAPLLGDEMLVCVLGGVYTDVEKTMIELQRTTVVQQPRNAFQNPMQQSSSPQSSAYQAAKSSTSSQTTTSAPTSKSNYSSSPPRTQPNRTSSDPRGC